MLFICQREHFTVATLLHCGATLATVWKTSCCNRRSLLHDVSEKRLPSQLSDNIRQDFSAPPSRYLHPDTVLLVYWDCLGVSSPLLFRFYFIWITLFISLFDFWYHFIVERLPLCLVEGVIIVIIIKQIKLSPQLSITLDTTLKGIKKF